MGIGMITMHREICKSLDELEASNQKKQIDVSSECEDSMGLFPDPITIKINGHPIEIIPIIC